MTAGASSSSPSQFVQMVLETSTPATVVSRREHDPQTYRITRTAALLGDRSWEARPPGTGVGYGSVSLVESVEGTTVAGLTLDPTGPATGVLTEVASTRGTWNLYTTVPAATGNLAGKSPLRGADVN